MAGPEKTPDGEEQPEQARSRLPKRVILVATALAAIAAPLALGALRTRGLDEEPASAPPPPAPIATEAPEPAEPVDPDPDPYQNIVAQAKVPEVAIYRSPWAEEPARTLAHPTDVGGPLVFLVQEERGDRLHVLLPVRPNGSTGWISRDQVRLSQHSYRIRVNITRHTIRVFNGPDVVLKTRVAVGTEDTPTPGGLYYIKELLQPPNPNTVYGTFAYGLSGFSNVLQSFAGGAGVIGLHGTNDPSVIGQDVSAGCIRMTNEDIESLVPILPLGTPVEIVG